MSPLTELKTVKDHVAHCKRLIAENEQSIGMFSSGEMRIGENNKDMTSAWIERLRGHNEVLKRVVEKLEKGEQE